MHISILSNPSHLEVINAVVIGSAWARIEPKKPKKILPVVIHGDAAI